MMDKSIYSRRWQNLQNLLKKKFNEAEDFEIESILFLIGLQEFGIKNSLNKDEKMSLIHVAVCCLLEPFGYYKFLGRDKDGWPHYELLEELPLLKKGEQQILLKHAILQYFEL